MLGCIALISQVSKYHFAGPTLPPSSAGRSSHCQEQADSGIASPRPGDGAERVCGARQHLSSWCLSWSCLLTQFSHLTPWLSFPTASLHRLSCYPTPVTAPCFSLTHNPNFSAFLCWKKHIASRFISPERDRVYGAWDPAESKAFKGGLGQFGADRASLTISRWSGYVPCLGKSQRLWLPAIKKV